MQDIPAKFGIQALNFEASYLVNLIESNPQMADGIAVFDQAGHGNDLIDAASIFAALTTIRTAMHRKTGLAGSPIAVAPRFVLVPPELETPMQQALSAIQANETDKVNPFSTLTLAVEPRLTSPAKWYVVADPAISDGLEYAYLEGAPGPQIETRAGFEVDGVQMCVRLDFGAGWIDHRAWHRAELAAQ